MNDYVPLDLASLCNAGLEAFGDGQQAPTGRQSFHGLPFLIGKGEDDDGESCFIALDGAASPVSIPVKQAARTVVFAHRLLESDGLDGGAAGKVVAEYVFSPFGRSRDPCPGPRAL